MAKPAAFMLILVHGLAEESARMMEPIIWSYELDASQVARVIWCKSVSPTEIGPFVRVEAKRHADDGFVEALIPSSVILAILGSAAKTPLGFHWAEGTQLPVPGPE